MNKGNISILFTIIVTVILTIIAGAVVIYFVGTERTTKEVSPLVEKVKDRVTDGVVPEIKRGDEPKTDADLIMDAVAANKASSVMIYESAKQGDAEGDFVARGVILSSDGFIATDGKVVTEGGEYEVSVPGMRDRFVVRYVANRDGVALLKIDITTSKVAYTVDVVSEPKQLVVAITGDEKMRIATGIVLGVDGNIVNTNIVGEIAPGSSLVSKDGVLIGISTINAQTGDKASFLSTKVLKEVYGFAKDSV